MKIKYQYQQHKTKKMLKLKSEAIPELDEEEDKEEIQIM